MALGKPTLSYSNQVKTCRGMTPNTVREKEKKKLKDMEQIIGLQSDVITSPSPPDSPLYTQSKRMVHGMSQPDCCVSSQSISQA